MVFLTAVSNPVVSLRVTRVSRTSISVSEKFPETSLDAMLCLCSG